MNMRKIFGFVGILVILGILVAFFDSGENQVAKIGESPSINQEAVQVKPPQTPNTIAITIASSNTKELWLQQAVKAFNQASIRNGNLQIDGHPIEVQVIKEHLGKGGVKDYRSGTMVADTLSGKIKPTIVSPGSTTWVKKLSKQWAEQNNGAQIINGASPPVLQTPIVLATWQPYAKKLGCYPIVTKKCTWKNILALASAEKGWGIYDKPNWGNFTLGYGYYGKSNSGTLGVAAACFAGLGKTSVAFNDIQADNGCGQFISQMENAKTHSGKSDGWLLEKMIERGSSFLHAVVTYESKVIARNTNDGHRISSPLVALYPQDGTFVADHPFAVLNGASWVNDDQVSAAQLFRNYLLSTEMQKSAMQYGLRPANSTVVLEDPFLVSNGVNIEVELQLLSPPDTLIFDSIEVVWNQNKKKSVVLLEIDVSGSMSGERIESAKSGALTFIDNMSLLDILGVMPFSTTVPDPMIGLKKKLGEQLGDEIAGLTPLEDTALRDAVAKGVRIIKHDYIPVYGKSMRYGIVVLSDGDDTASRTSMPQLEYLLSQDEKNPHGIQVHTICIGSKCNVNALKKIARHANGKYWQGHNKKDMRLIFEGIGLFY